MNYAGTLSVHIEAEQADDVIRLRFKVEAALADIVRKLPPDKAITWCVGEVKSIADPRREQ